MNWQPLTEAELWDRINDACDRMSPEQRKIWEIIKIPPAKWSQEPYGNEGNGFWIVALIGSSVIWYNDIEEGFDRSLYSEHGRIAEYWCNRDRLERAVQHVMNLIRDGHYSAGRAGPPKPVA
jgi:hypothetical protein